MGVAAYILMAAMAVVCALLVIGARWLETQYYRSHPPDEDPCRVEHFEEDKDDEQR